jgi:hypothetical protein
VGVSFAALVGGKTTGFDGAGLRLAVTVIGGRIVRFDCAGGFGGALGTDG